MSSPPLLDPLVLPLIDGGQILDVACWKGKWGYLIRACWWATRSGSNTPPGYSEPDLLVGTDLWEPSLQYVQDHRVYDGAVRSDVRHLPFRDGAFEVVLACEILEHIDKKDGGNFLTGLERISKKTVIISTPREPGRRDPSQTELAGNPGEGHVSKWSFSELKGLGYRVYGELFSIPLIGDKGPMKHLQFLLSRLAYRFPRFAGYYVAVKHVTKEQGHLQSHRLKRSA